MPLITFGVDAARAGTTSPLAKAIVGLLVGSGAAVVAKALTKTTSKTHQAHAILAERITAKIPAESMQEVVFERRR
jgi:hypothetical protein